MGWANCGTDGRGRRIGYAVSARCDEPRCATRINRGLSYACGGMHGNDTIWGGVFVCEGYYCSKHLHLVETKQCDVISVCARCRADLARDDELKADP